MDKNTHKNVFQLNKHNQNHQDDGFVNFKHFIDLYWQTSQTNVLQDDSKNEIPPIEQNHKNVHQVKKVYPLIIKHPRVTYQPVINYDQQNSTKIFKLTISAWIWTLVIALFYFLAIAIATHVPKNIPLLIGINIFATLNLITKWLVLIRIAKSFMHINFQNQVIQTHFVATHKYYFWPIINQIKWWTFLKKSGKM